MRLFALLALVPLSLAGMSGSVEFKAQLAVRGVGDNTASSSYVRHRRHHARAGRRMVRRQSTNTTKAKKCKSRQKRPQSSGSLGNSTSSPSGSSSSGSHCPSNALASNGLCIGMLPDGGSDGGPQNTLSQLNSLITSTTSKFAYFGQYAQVTDASWDGSQLTQVMDDLKSSGAIFQPAVMPTGGFDCFSESDPSCAKQVCNVMKQFTDEGIEVWLRFAHECNWYITDGTYKGTLDQCKTAFQTVAQQCKTIAPAVKMFWTPNSGDMGTYQAMWPGAENVDYIGIDFYPKDASNLDTAFVQAMKPLHDQYTSASGPYFAIGETGLGFGGASDDQKIQFFKSQLTATSSMPHFKASSWFNYIKTSESGNFKIVDPDNSGITEDFVGLFKQ